MLKQYFPLFQLTTKELCRVHLQLEIAKADLELEYTKLLIEVKKEVGQKFKVDMILLFKVVIILFFLPQQLKNKNEG